MSNRRSIFWLAMLSIALAAANVAVFSSGRGASIVKRTALLDPSEEVSAITLERRGHQAIVLRRESAWRIVEPYSGSADERAVLRFLDALRQAQVAESSTDEEILRTGHTRSSYGLDSPCVVVTVSGGAFSEVISFGDRTAASNEVYAAVGGESAVLTVATNVLAAVDVKAEGFRRRALFDVGAEDVSAFEVKARSGSTTSFVREGNVWKVGGTPALASKVKEFLSAAVSTEAVGFVWPVGATNEEESVSTALLSVYELDPESAVTLTLKCSDGNERQVAFGRHAEDSLVYALVQNAGAIVTIDAGLKGLAVQGAAAFTDARLFPFDEAGVTSFTVADGDVQYVVARGEGDAWRLDSPVAASADAATAKAMLGKVLSLSSSDVRKAGLVVSVSTNAPSVIVDAQRILGDLRLADLRSKEIFRIDPVLVKRIVSTPGGDEQKPTAVVYRRDLRVWKPEDVSSAASVAAAGVEKVLSAINPLKAERVVALKVTAGELGEYGLEKPFLTVAIDQETGDAVRRNILVGGRTEGGRFATVGSSEAIFVISDETVDALSSQLVE